MNLKNIFNSITENWFIKIICLILAILLYGTYNSISTETKTFSIPLTVYSDRNLVPANNIEKTIQISVKTSPDNISILHQSDFKAYIDLDQYSISGKYDVPVRIELTPKVQVMEPLEVVAKPKKIPVMIEEKVSRLIPVEVLFTGEPAEGFEVIGTTMQPQEIKISGPFSIVESFQDTITITIGLTEREKPFNQNVPVSPLVKNPLVRIEEPTAVFTSVNIVPKQITRTFQNVPVHFASLNPFFTVKQETPLSIVVSGNQNYLSSYSLSQYAIQADCSSIDMTGTYTLPFTVHLPNELTFVSASAEEITISVDTAPIEEMP